MIFLILFRVCSTPKLSNYVALSPVTYNAIQYILVDLCVSRLLHITHPLFYENGFLNKCQESQVHFDNRFVVQKQLNDDVEFKILFFSNYSFTCSYYSSSRYFSFHSFLPVKRFLNKLAANIPNIMLGNSLFHYFASFFNVFARTFYQENRIFKKFNYFYDIIYFFI